MVEGGKDHMALLHFTTVLFHLIHFIHAAWHVGS